MSARRLCSGRWGIAALLGALLGLGGCTTTALPPPILDGSLATALGPASGTPEAEDPFHLSAADRRWLVERIDPTLPKPSRFRALLALFDDEGELSLVYDLATSTAASDTLAARRGNCLSFTVLFVALARELGFEARVQEVSIPPAWSRLEDVAVANRHVVAWGRFDGRPWEVDFGRFTRPANAPRRLFDDEEVRAVLASNQGASLLAANEDALPRLRAALHVDDALVQGWINLGVGLARDGELASAEFAFRRALERAPGDASALSGLLRLYRTLDPQRAAELEAVMPRLLARNPWVLYASGQRAVEAGDDAAAIIAFEGAVKAAPQDPWFHLALVKARLAVADASGAERALRRAERRLADPAEYALLVAELLRPAPRELIAVADVVPKKAGKRLDGLPLELVDAMEPEDPAAQCVPVRMNPAAALGGSFRGAILDRRGERCR